MTAITNRYEFVYLFDVRLGNPNGDPDADNQPRTTLETGHGIVTDVCMKRKVRNYAEMTGQPIYITEGTILGDTHAESIAKSGIETNGKGKAKGKKKDDDDDEGNGKPSREQLGAIKADMCRRFYDIRTFGAVLANKAANDSVRGPVQLSFAQSIEPVVPQRHTITRCAAQKEEDGKENKTMGAKWTLGYGLYRAHGYISAPLAAKTGFSDDDLNLLWSSLTNMFDHDRTAARGEMAARKLIVFKHSSDLGNAPAHKLFEAVSVKRVNGSEGPARGWADYAVTIGTVPDGIDVFDRI